ncbi:hypothetical protein IWW51_004097, partial [Coemansia sp. RSA 2702]
LPRLFDLQGAYSHTVDIADGGRTDGDGASAPRTAEPRPFRRMSYVTTDYADQQHTLSQPESIAAKPSFPAVFGSIKPFIGKGDDRVVRHGASMANSGYDQSFAHLLYPQHTLRPESEQETGNAGRDMYRAGVLDGPGLQKGLHRAMAGLTEYMGTIFDNVKPDDQRQDGGEHQRDGYAEIVAGGPTFEQIRRLRAYTLRVTREQDLELSTAAIGWVYFEKLILKGYVVKDNRKLVAAVCLFLAMKINESRETIQRRFEVSEDSILDQEFSVFAELDFSLWVPCREFMPHLVRMFEAA